MLHLRLSCIPLSQPSYDRLISVRCIKISWILTEQAGAQFPHPQHKFQCLLTLDGVHQYDGERDRGKTHTVICHQMYTDDDCMEGTSRRVVVNDQPSRIDRDTTASLALAFQLKLAFTVKLATLDYEILDGCDRHWWDDSTYAVRWVL